MASGWHLLFRLMHLYSFIRLFVEHSHSNPFIQSNIFKIVPVGYLSRQSFPLRPLAGNMIWFYFWFISAAVSLLRTFFVSVSQTAHWAAINQLNVRFPFATKMQRSWAKVVKQVALITYEWQIIPPARVVIFMYYALRNMWLSICSSEKSQMRLAYNP